MKQLLKISFIVLILILFTGCSVLFSKMYGVNNNLEEFNSKKYNEFILKVKEKVNCVAIVSDKGQYQQVINLGNDKNQKNNLGQPVQIIYFEKNKIKSFHANCFAKGNLRNLDWNTENRFSSFLPKSAINTDIFSIELKDYNNIYPKVNIDLAKDYTIIIFWTFLIDRISYSAIETVIENLNKHNKINDVNLYLINTDKYFSKI